MSIRRINFVAGEYYHIYNRGNSKQKIFLDVEDYKRFMNLLYLGNSDNYRSFQDQIIKLKRDAYLFQRGSNYVNILSFVLMPNHFHILITPRAEGAGLEVSLFMRKLCQSYTQYFNTKYNRTGTLFEGPFQSEHVATDNYFKYLVAYIHLNPVKLIQSDWKEKGIKNISEVKEFLTNYKYSSLIDFINDGKNKHRIESQISDRHLLYSLFEKETRIPEEIFRWIGSPRAEGAG